MVTKCLARAVMFSGLALSVRAATAQQPAHAPEISAADPTLPGGNHQIGVWGGFSLHSGHYLGFDKGVKFFPFDVRYSYRFALFPHYVVRYSPEATVFALMDEPNHPTWDSTSPTTPTRLSKGGGLSPVGFELDLRPRTRVQPFFTENSGVIYFDQRVLSPDGSQLMFTTDLGLGINFFPQLRRAITVGYRYQHMSNANISHHNPGTDANTFYLGFSRFHTKDVK